MYLNYIDIVGKADNNLKPEPKKLLHIIRDKSSLNEQLNSQYDYDIKTIIVKAFQKFRE